MLTFTFETIFGVELGISFADNEVKDYHKDMEWGISISLLIVCLTICKWKD
jgi:hypothetical protein